MLFPVLIYRFERHVYPEPPPDVPWALVARHVVQAQRNHSQTLERLAERGGLGPSELVAVIEDRPWTPMAPEKAMARLRELVGAYTGAYTGVV